MDFPWIFSTLSSWQSVNSKTWGKCWHTIYGKLFQLTYEPSHVHVIHKALPWNADQPPPLSSASASSSSTNSTWQKCQVIETQRNQMFVWKLTWLSPCDRMPVGLVKKTWKIEVSRENNEAMICEDLWRSVKINEVRGKCLESINGARLVHSSFIYICIYMYKYSMFSYC